MYHFIYAIVIYFGTMMAFVMFRSLLKKPEQKKDPDTR